MLTCHLNFSFTFMRQAQHFFCSLFFSRSNQHIFHIDQPIIYLKRTIFRVNFFCFCAAIFILNYFIHQYMWMFLAKSHSNWHSFPSSVLLMSTHCLTIAMDMRTIYIVQMANTSKCACCQLTTMLLHSFRHIFAMITKIALQSLSNTVFFFCNSAHFSIELNDDVVEMTLSLRLTFYTQLEFHKFFYSFWIEIFFFFLSHEIFCEL